MTIEITAFKAVPAFAEGHVKDLRVRWALEEAGLGYREHLIEEADQATPAYRRRQPFGQVPAYKDAHVELFETGAILLYLAERHEALAPADPAARARVAAWAFAALNSIEPYSSHLDLTDLFYAETEWAKGFRPVAVELLNERLAQLDTALGDKNYLEGGFTAADILMGTVLRDIASRGALEAFPNLGAYRQRCEARPAFQRALAAQLDAFERHKGA